MSRINNKQNDNLSENDIIQGYISMVQRNKPSTKVFPNIFIENFECDILELTKSGYLYEFEVKITLADFKNDAKKATFRGSKYDQIKSGIRTNYFSYICPKDVLLIDDIPEFAGLFYVEKRECRFYSDERGYYLEDRLFFNCIKSAPKLSNEKITEKRLMKLIDSIYMRFHSYRKKLMPSNY